MTTTTPPKRVVLHVAQLDKTKPLTPMNCHVTLDGKEVEGVSRIVIEPIDANKPDTCKAEITAEVTFDLNVAAMRNPWNDILRRELLELRATMCPAGCGQGIDPQTMPLEEGLHHAFGRCPAETINLRLRALNQGLSR